MNKIFNHSCEKMPELMEGEVSLTVTSPPYWNAIDYDIHSKNNNEHYRTRKYNDGYDGYGDYLIWISNIFNEVLRVTKPGGFCAIVLGTVLFKGKHFPVPFDITHNLIQSGWEFHQDIIWHKTTAGVKRAGVTIQKPYPGYFYPNIMSEYILIFKKPGPSIYKERKRIEKENAKFSINKLFTMDIANNLWHIAPIPPNIIDHPCPFPEEIPFRLIQMYSYPDEIILDPFTGSGQTLKVAKNLGRKFVGYETIQKYIDLSLVRIEEPLSIRPKQLIARFEKISLDDPTADKSTSFNYPTRIKNRDTEKSEQLGLGIENLQINDK